MLLWNNAIVDSRGLSCINAAMIHTNMAEWRCRPLYALAIIWRLKRAPPNNCGRVIGLATPDQIENHWRGDDEDWEDAGLHTRMSAI